MWKQVLPQERRSVTSRHSRKLGHAAQPTPPWQTRADRFIGKLHHKWESASYIDITYLWINLTASGLENVLVNPVIINERTNHTLKKKPTILKAIFKKQGFPKLLRAAVEYIPSMNCILEQNFGESIK